MFVKFETCLIKTMKRIPTFSKSGSKSVDKLSGGRGTDPGGTVKLPKEKEYIHHVYITFIRTKILPQDERSAVNLSRPTHPARSMLAFFNVLALFLRQDTGIILILSPCSVPGTKLFVFPTTLSCYLHYEIIKTYWKISDERWDSNL
jgi:hypothetical protein